MQRILRITARWIQILLSVVPVCFAIERLVWLRHLPRSASARWCGNCLMGAVGVPIEVGLLGIVWVTAALLRVRWSSIDAVWWCSAVVGIVLSPLILGVPVFVFALVALLWSTLKGALRRA